MLAWGVFGGIAFVGFLMSFGIRSPDLEADGWGEQNGPNRQDGDANREIRESDALLSRQDSQAK